MAHAGLGGFRAALPARWCSCRPACSAGQRVLLVLAAGARLSAYIGATVGEIGFLRGFWMDGSRRLAWLEDYAASIVAPRPTCPCPPRLREASGSITSRSPTRHSARAGRRVAHLPAGAVVAIVGENGAGKTTLVKLLAKMYEPPRAHPGGRHAAGARSGRRVARAAGGRIPGFLPLRVPRPAHSRPGRRPALDDEPAVVAAVDRAGAGDVVARLAAGLDTQLGPTWPDGVELSFGQWQKLALARGFMRDQPLLLVLDEPTAALDAETEHALFERYAAAARAGATRDGRITVLVSHRFSTVRMADLIVVLDGARMVEYGRHEELMARKGPYSELYEFRQLHTADASPAAIARHGRIPQPRDGRLKIPASDSTAIPILDR